MWGAILLAGGSGSRMGSACNKVLLKLGGVSVIARSARALLPHVDRCVLVCRDQDREALRASLREAGIDPDGLLWAEGGADRQASVWNGLQALPAECDMVMIHDGARCLVDDATIENVMRSVESCGSGVASAPAVDTIKVADAALRVLSTPDRRTLRTIQTPQGFRTELILRAHRYADAHGFRGTDDASLLEYAGLPVQLTEGSRGNIKLTTPEDMKMAQAMLTPDRPLPETRIGQGYDVHRLAEGRKLILCGVEIPHTLGLLGHSDADVALHALMDAMLGACALGDIGKHFPDTDERYRGISSMKLLDAVVALLDERGFRVTNCDVTIVAQRPKLLPHVPQMRANVAAALRLPEEQVNIKATTTERLGFEGEEKGISAQAVCMVQKTD